MTLTIAKLVQIKELLDRQDANLNWRQRRERSTMYVSKRQLEILRGPTRRFPIERRQRPFPRRWQHPVRLAPGWLDRTTGDRRPKL